MTASRGPSPAPTTSTSRRTRRTRPSRTLCGTNAPQQQRLLAGKPHWSTQGTRCRCSRRSSSARVLAAAVPTTSISRRSRRRCRSRPQRELNAAQQRGARATASAGANHNRRSPRSQVHVTSSGWLAWLVTARAGGTAAAARACLQHRRRPHAQVAAPDRSAAAGRCARHAYHGSGSGTCWLAACGLTASCRACQGSRPPQH